MKVSSFFILFKFAAGVIIDEPRQDHFAVVTGGIGDTGSTQSINYPDAIRLSSTEILIDDMWWFGEFGLNLPVEFKILNFQSDLQPSKGFFKKYS